MTTGEQESARSNMQKITVLITHPVLTLCPAPSAALTFQHIPLDICCYFPRPWALRWQVCQVSSIRMTVLRHRSPFHMEIRVFIFTPGSLRWYDPLRWQGFWQNSESLLRNKARRRFTARYFSCKCFLHLIAQVPKRLIHSLVTYCSS